MIDDVHVLWKFQTSDGSTARLIVISHANGENTIALQEKKTKKEAHECPQCGKTHGKRTDYETVGEVCVRDGTEIPRSFGRMRSVK